MRVSGQTSFIPLIHRQPKYPQPGPVPAAQEATGQGQEGAVVFTTTTTTTITTTITATTSVTVTAPDLPQFGLNSIDLATSILLQAGREHGQMQGARLFIQTGSGNEDEGQKKVLTRELTRLVLEYLNLDSKNAQKTTPSDIASLAENSQLWLQAQRLADQKNYNWSK